MGRKFYLLFVLLLVSASGFSQLKVDKLGHIGMGTNYPNNGYRLHVKGDVLLTNWPEQPWYEFQFKVAQKDGAVIGCTGGTIDFYTSNSGYNTLIAYKFKTHSTWDREGEGLGDALKIIMGLKPQCVTETNENQMKKTYSFSPDELIKFIPSAIDIVEDGYCTDYD